MSDTTTAVARTRRGPASLTPSQMGGGGKRYTPHPDGKHVVRCVDVLDLGEEEFKGKNRHRLSFVFASDRVDEEGEPKLIQHYVTTSLFGGDPSQGISPSGHMKMLREMLGRPGLTQDQLRRKNQNGEESYNTAKLVGRVFTANVVHETSASGRQYGKIVKFSPASPEDSGRPLPLDDYYRPDFLHARTVESRDEKAAVGGDPFDTAEPPAAKPAESAISDVQDATNRQTIETGGEESPYPAGEDYSDAAAHDAELAGEESTRTDEDVPF